MDYSNTIFYKIYCVDPSINDLYIGHTTNFVQRRCAHKQGCNNVKSANYKCKLYKVIRENAGWDNWKMDIIAFHNCDNLLGAKTQEQKYFEEYKATLNSIEPLSKPKLKIVNDVAKKEKSIFYCDKCNIHFHSSKTQEVHNTTRKHIQNSAIVNNVTDVKRFICESCDFYSANKKDYTRHITTRKHKTLTNSSNNYSCECCSFYTSKKHNYLSHLDTRKHKMITNDARLNTKHNSYSCVCGKEYKHRQGLCAHKKKCSQLKEDNTRDKPEPEPTNKIVTVLLEQNALYQEQNTMFQELILKNEEEKNELLRRTEEQQLRTEEQQRRNEEDRRKTDEEKGELQKQMMDLQKQFLEAIKKGNKVITVE